MIRTVVVDDSAVVRSILKKILENHPNIKVVGEASNGKELLEKINLWKPDIVTLDVNMPVMGGLEVLPLIKDRCPTCKVIMISALTKEGAKETIEALNKGAIDFIPKPKSYSQIFEFEKEIINKIMAAYSTEKGIEYISKDKIETPEIPKVTHKQLERNSVVAIGVSTGGPPTLSKILPRIDKDFPAPILVAIHMPDTFTSSFAEHLNAKCKLRVKEAENGEKLEKGTIYISRGRINMKVKGTPPDVYIAYEEPKGNIYIPSVDELFFSVAEVFRNNAIGVVLTGMGNDGSKGVVEIKKRGGITIAEDPDTAVLWAMPKNAIDTGSIDYIVSADQIPALLERLVMGVRVKGG